jgi:hypothetical protein
MAMATAMAIMGGISAGIVAIIMAGATTATAIATDAGDRRRLERVLILSGRVRTSPPRPLSRPEVLRPRDQSGLNAPPYKFRHANLLALRSGRAALASEDQSSQASCRYKIAVVCRRSS